MNEDALIGRILSVIPAYGYEMSALLSLLRIEITTEVPTACVSCERRPVLRVNPEFVAAHCRTDEHLFLLVMHELHHVLLGHTRLFARPSIANNLAFDAVINALLMMRFPGRAYSSFFLELYGDQEGVARLLAPPDGHPIADARLAALHARLYGDGNTTAEEIFRAVVKEAEQHTGNQLPALLGTHGDLEDLVNWGTEGPASADFVQALREIVEKWPPPADPLRGRSLADVMARRDVSSIDPAERVLRVTRCALTAAATGRGLSRRVDLRPVVAQVPIPVLGDRRAAVARASGWTPVLHQASLVARARSSGAADVYIDVSGSMSPYISHLYGALTRLHVHIAPDVAMFSTQVKRIALPALMQGYCETTGGTDISCVMEDITRRCAKKVLIVTDGYVGSPAEQHVKALRAKGTEARVLLTPKGWREDLQGIAARMDELPEL